MKKEDNRSNKIVRVLAVDDNESLIGMLEEYFKDHEKIKVESFGIKFYEKIGMRIQKIGMEIIL